MMDSKFWQVAVDAPLDRTLTYQVNPEANPEELRGRRVSVPLGKRKALGVLLRPGGTPDAKFEIKSISEFDTLHPRLPDKFVQWLEWLAEYYHHPIGQVFSSAYPPLVPQEKSRKSNRSPVIPQLERSHSKQLSDEQRKVFESIKAATRFQTHLLFGVTGSGKTEIYLQLLEDVLMKGKRGLVLVPEISLTPQLVSRFAERFGDQIAVLHSHLTDRERTNQWWSIVNGQKKILIGARSALFCPIDDLGLIVVDEEHEPSFKQDEKLKYHARDAAIYLAKLFDCPIVLGSATPSLESWKNAQDGKFKLHRMSRRVTDIELPSISVVDMKEQKNKDSQVQNDLPGWLSHSLYEVLQSNFESGFQSALFLNRRGMAQFVICKSCAHTEDCPNCDISLTLHGKKNLVCHYCNFQKNLEHDCPVCREGEMSTVGVGTEAIEKELQRLFPEATIARADRDEISRREDMEALISEMENGKIDFLIGTQMIAKGLDFPKLKVVGLVLADVGFHLPDFRATERSFQLITQVAGRAGRHRTGTSEEHRGKVIIQTFNPTHPSIQFALNHDFEGFAKSELSEREPLRYPPFSKLVSIRLQGLQLPNVQKSAKTLATRCLKLKEQNPQYNEIEILGPSEAAFAKLRGQHRYHLLLKGPGSQIAKKFIVQVLGDESWVSKGVKLSVDVDPLHLL